MCSRDSKMGWWSRQQYLDGVMKKILAIYKAKCDQQTAIFTWLFVMLPPQCSSCIAGKHSEESEQLSRQTWAPHVEVDMNKSINIILVDGLNTSGSILTARWVNYCKRQFATHECVWLILLFLLPSSGQIVVTARLLLQEQAFSWGSVSVTLFWNRATKDISTQGKGRLFKSNFPRMTLH